MRAVSMPTGWLVLNRDAGDLEGQVYRAVRERVLSGQLAPGQRLPSTRALASALGVARSTVVQAFERLRAEGFLEAATGSATRVATLSTPFPAQCERGTGRAGPADVAHLAEPERGIFQPGVPSLSDFPHVAWARCLGARARALRVHDLGYKASFGIAELTTAVLEHVSASRGVIASPDQVIILPSTSAAIDLISRLLIQPGVAGRDTAWIEEPGYPVAQALLRSTGARLVGVPCDVDGMDVAGVAGPPPQLIYVTPSHQYPTGAVMSLQRRLALLDIAQRSGAVVLEDDYDSEFQRASRPIAALQGIDRGGCVAYLGTFSKVLAPGLRIAYAILPSRLVTEARAVQQLRGLVVPIHMQAALADFLRDGYLRAHLRRMGAIYAARMAATADALNRYCGSALSVENGASGLQLAAWFRDLSTDDRVVTQRLRREGFGMRALSEFYLDAPRPGLLFGISEVLPNRANELAKRLRRNLD